MAHYSVEQRVDIIRNAIVGLVQGKMLGQGDPTASGRLGEVAVRVIAHGNTDRRTISVGDGAHSYFLGDAGAFLCCQGLSDRSSRSSWNGICSITRGRAHYAARR
jgi:hypothetical protein